MEPVTVHRLAKYQTDDPFTRVPNTAVNDDRLDLKSRGLLLVMLSKPDGWTFRERHLAQISGVGRDQLRAAMQTLIEAGYVVRTREAHDGKPPTSVTRVFDVPQSDNTGVGFSDRRETRPLSNKGDRETNELKPLPQATVRKVDGLWDAVCKACEIAPGQLTQSGRGALNRAVKELREAGATAGDVAARAAAYRKAYPNAACTPMALAKHWASLAPEAKPKRQSAWETYEPQEYY